MAKVSVKNLNLITKSLNKNVDDFVKDQRTQEKIAKKMQDEYRLNIREGYDANSQPLKALDSKTIAQRKKLKEYGNKTSQSYAPDRSNLTFTGELVQKIFIQFDSFKKNKMIFMVIFDGEHKPYKTKNGQSKKTPSRIIDIARGLLDHGYNLFGFPSRKAGQVSERVVSLFKDYLRRK